MENEKQEVLSSEVLPSSEILPSFFDRFSKDDIFAEQLIVKKSSSQDNARRVFILVGVFLIIAAIFFMSYIIHPALLAAIVGVIWYYSGVFKSVYTEYEYTITNGDIDITKITGKAKRTPLLNAELKNTTLFKTYEPKTDRKLLDESETVIAAHSRDENGKIPTKILLLSLPKFGNTAVIFNPNERISEAVNKSIPRNIREL